MIPCPWLCVETKKVLVNERKKGVVGRRGDGVSDTHEGVRVGHESLCVTESLSHTSKSQSRDRDTRDTRSSHVIET